MMSNEKINLSFIKNRRISLGITLQEMANLVGMTSKENYYRYESGQYAFKADDIPKLQQALNTDKESLFTTKVTKLETISKE